MDTHAVKHTSPTEISRAATSTTRVSPSTLHFCRRQFGEQLWLAKRDSLPMGPDAQFAFRSGCRPQQGARREGQGKAEGSERGCAQYSEHVKEEKR